jgi:hypothetical protein
MRQSDGGRLPSTTMRYLLVKPMRRQSTRHLIMLGTAAALRVPERQIAEQPKLSRFNNRASVELVRWRSRARLQFECANVDPAVHG